MCSSDLTHTPLRQKAQDEGEGRKRENSIKTLEKKRSKCILLINVMFPYLYNQDGEVSVCVCVRGRELMRETQLECSL